MATVISNGQLTTLSGNFMAGTLPIIDPGVPLEQYEAVSIQPEQVWYTQPAVRKVVDFIARQIASTPLKAYTRQSDNDRTRITTGPLAAALNAPSTGVTPYRHLHSLIVDWLLFDRWVAAKAGSSTPGHTLDLVRIPAKRTQIRSDGLGRVTSIWLAGLDKDADPAGFLYDHGYSPQLANGVTPMRTLQAILEESAEAVEYRRSIWKRGARFGTVITRPEKAPDWIANGGRERFLQGWREFTRDGGKGGGTPILEDGMTLAKVEAFSPRDTKDIEGRQLNDIEVASAFHIAPELVGARQGNYSNMQAFRDALYGQALGPYYVAFEQVYNTMLVPDIGGPDDYIEFDVASKLRGSFEEQAQILSTAIGAPWLTRNEGRGLQNLPRVDGGDALVTPLNVLEGGQASPRDSGSQNLAPKAARHLAKAQEAFVKARTLDAHRTTAEKRLAAFFTAQRDEVGAALGQKSADDWWDAKQWDDQLTSTLHALSATVADEIGRQSAESLGFEADDYDVDRTAAYLAAASRGRAESINATTLDQINAALASEDDADTPDAVFDLALAQRVPSMAVQLVTSSAGFATTEAARQLGGGKASKTWQTGAHPRASHAEMNGETVGIDEKFSNGLDWPGSGGDADEVAGCNCGIEVSV